MQQLGNKEEKPNMIWKIVRIGCCCRLIRACLWIEQNLFLMSRLFVQAPNEIWSKLNFFWIRISFYNFLFSVAEWGNLFIYFSREVFEIIEQISMKISIIQKRKSFIMIKPLLLSICFYYQE